MIIKPTDKIRVLVASCIVLLITLCCIQYYLVINSFRLTKEAYFTEVTTEMDKISQETPLAAVRIKSIEEIFKLLDLYKVHKITRIGFLTRLKTTIEQNRKRYNGKLNEFVYQNELLKGMRYRLQYDEITFEQNGVTDIILSRANDPLIFIGEKFNNQNTYQIKNPNDITEIKSNVSPGKGNINDAFSLKFSKSAFIDISKWQEQVFIRMASIFALAVILILAVILLFYLILSALLKQKKIAEIKTDFANNITNELKTPLTSLGLIIKSLKKEEVYNNPVAVINLVDSLENQNTKILHIVDDVLETAKSSDIEVVLSKTEITSSLTAFSSDLNIPSHVLKIEIEPKQQFIFTNTKLLEKVLNHLLENAVKYSDEGSEITLKAYKNRRSYLIEIIDNGPGIAAKNQKYIFEKFYRVLEQNSKQSVKGLGLGLYLSKIATDQLGCSISIKSKPGDGCTFTIKLPVKKLV